MFSPKKPITEWDCARADVRIYFEGGEVVGWEGWN